jgi:ABC-type uncharacterized transport system permease subunit
MPSALAVIFGFLLMNSIILLVDSIPREIFFNVGLKPLSPKKHINKAKKTI